MNRIVFAFLFFAIGVCSSSAERVTLGRLEFNGFIKFGESVRVSIHDKKDGTSAWLNVGQYFGDLQLVSVGPDETSILLKSDFQALTLELKDVRIGPLEFDVSSMKRDAPKDIAFDASMIMLYERGQNLSKSRSRR